MNKRTFSVSLLLALGLQSMANATEPTPSTAAGTLWTEPKTGMQFVWVPSGCFNMGRNHSGGNSEYKEELPVHKVCLKGFWMGRHEVTQGQYRQLMKKNPSLFGGTTKLKGHWGEQELPAEFVQPLDSRNHPVEWVKFNEAERFARKMTSRAKIEVELPSEAQWEYACRAGGAHLDYCGNTDGKPDRVAWYEYNNGQKSYKQDGLRTYKMLPHHPVGQLNPNNWGLYDMSGNVAEWTQDCLNDTYQGAPADGSAWKSGNCLKRMVRGGFWGYSAQGVTATGRGGFDIDAQEYAIGFRVVRTSP
ncbi:MAG: formylglycine-generating enzyme family protein [Gallionella sp.]|jgi:formylglycine-generating enzyme required for sulfatase activity